MILVSTKNTRNATINVLACPPSGATRYQIARFLNVDIKVCEFEFALGKVTKRPYAKVKVAKATKGAK